MDPKVLLLMPLAFVCEFIDSSLGMGYGTSLTPILLLMGFEPLQVVPAVLLSEFVSGITAASFHHSIENVSFKPGSKDTKVALALSAFAVLGTIIAVFLAVKLPAKTLKLWIGAIVLFMGIFILATFNRKPRFTWRKIATLGTVASFNKGMSGGGYGPLVMGGQLLSGISAKNAVGITSLSEGVTCLVGIILYFFLKSQADWTLAPWLMAGAVLSVPLAAHTLKRLPERKVKIAIAVIIVTLGCLTLAKALFRG
ncbi:MAG: sulfite exporter TauE/SafE family protein [Candidatus Omnitrophota bacterium]|nr:MAG: sulfite exporter TauE/SafE family protein [Candidatus Omnitrophota bacterium]